MTHVLTVSLLATALLGSVAHASDADRQDSAEKRLRGCIAAGASTAPKASLASAVQHVRTFCGPQIGNLVEFRVSGATEGLSDAEAEEAKARTIRELNNEIAYAVANFTGLTQ